MSFDFCFVTWFNQGDFGRAPHVMFMFDFRKINGFFFEAGAFDGVLSSNTLLMETAFNWTGKIKTVLHR